ncbi:MAG: helix-hairpin-helix domain-containing protein [Pirellula sp.]
MQDGIPEAATSETPASIQIPTAELARSALPRSALIEQRNRGLAALLIVLVIWTAGVSWMRAGKLEDKESLPTEFVVELNSATEAELNLLPGVGTKLAKEILHHRQQIGGFDSVDELKNIKGIKEGRIAALKKHLTISR